MEKNKREQKKSEYSKLERDLIESSDVIKEFTFALDTFSAQTNLKNPKNHRSYVYALCERVGESLIPFYIGEGKGPRVWSHEMEASKQVDLLKEELDDEGIAEDLDERKQDISEKIKKIKEINDRNGKVVKYIIKWGMTAKEAFMVESALINLLRIGGLKFDSGSNDRLTNIVKGHMSDGEKQVSLTQAWEVEEFCKNYGKKPLYYEDLAEDLAKKKVKAILINIRDKYPECLKFKKTEDREKAVRDTVCGNWIISGEGLDYVFATDQARIVGIYKIKKVDGKKTHFLYECVKENSQYPHGEGTVPCRNSDYKDAELFVDIAKKKGKDLSELVFDDMPRDYKEKLIAEVEIINEKAKKAKKAKEKKTPNDLFNDQLTTILERKYMILENISEGDPIYSEYNNYLYRRVIHNDKYVENKKLEKQKNGKDPNKATNNVFGSGNPLKYIE